MPRGVALRPRQCAAQRRQLRHSFSGQVHAPAHAGHHVSRRAHAGVVHRAARTTAHEAAVGVGVGAFLFGRHGLDRFTGLARTGLEHPVGIPAALRHAVVAGVFVVAGKPVWRPTVVPGPFGAGGQRRDGQPVCPRRHGERIRDELPRRALGGLVFPVEEVEGVCVAQQRAFAGPVLCRAAGPQRHRTGCGDCPGAPHGGLCAARPPAPSTRLGVVWVAVASRVWDGTFPV
jgi:hypothetical protein